MSKWSSKSSWPKTTHTIDEKLWLYISCIVQPRPKFVTDGSLTTKILNNANLRQQIEITGSATSIKALEDSCYKLSQIISRVQPLPILRGTTFEDLIKQRRYSELWRNKVFIRIIGEGQFGEFIGKQGDVDRLISELNTEKPGQFQRVTSSVSVSFDPSGRGVQVIGEFQTYHVKFAVAVALGNILDSRCDVIVCPNNPNGVAKVIMDAAGDAVRDECRRKQMSIRQLKVSDVVHTSAGGLQHMAVKNIIHACVPQVMPGINSHSDELLMWTFLNCFTCANTMGAASIALPTIGAGMIDSAVAV